MRAFEAGAADYLVKPFSSAELTARVGAALRRREGAEPFVLGELAIDYEQRRVSVAGSPVALTRTEYEAASRALGQRGGGWPRTSRCCARYGEGKTPLTCSGCATS